MSHPSRFGVHGHFKVQPGLSLRRLDGGAVEVTIWSDGHPVLEPIIVHAQDWVDGVVAVTPGAEQLGPHDWQLRQIHALQLHESRGGHRRPPPTEET